MTLFREILLAAWQALRTYRGDSRLQSWILGIARHKIDDHYRRRMREEDMITEEEDFELEPATLPILEQQLDSATQQKKVQKILPELPESYALARSGVIAMRGACVRWRR